MNAKLVKALRRVARGVVPNPATKYGVKTEQDVLGNTTYRLELANGTQRHLYKHLKGQAYK